MKKVKLSLTFVFIFFFYNSFTQIPTGYYIRAEDLNGEQLKKALNEIIKDHIEFPYTSSSTDTWDILKETDRDTANADNVILFYSGWSVNAAQEYNNAQGWSREYVWAKSHGDFGTDLGAGTDIHHLRPTDNSVNAARSNLDFDYGGTLYIDGDGVTKCKKDNDSWEPRDAVKGDVARMLFYMAVRYEGENGELDLELVDTVNTANFDEINMGYHGKLSTLLKWHKSDPVDSFEINRNNVIYAYQKNRNPFIDHPEYVDKIWDDGETIVFICKDSVVSSLNDIWSPILDDSYSNYGISYYGSNPLDAIFLMNETYVSSDLGNEFCPDTLSREYVAYDMVGNSATCIQKITVKNTGECSICQDTVQYRLADLNNAPDSVWVSDNNGIRNGACCSLNDSIAEWGCISFNVYLDEEAVGLIFDVYKPSPPGIEYYRIDCGEPIPLGNQVCLKGGTFNTLTFCKTGDDRPTYSIRSVPGIIAPDSIVCQDQGSEVEFHVENIDPSSVSWEVLFPMNEDSLLDYLDISDPINPVFKPDVSTPERIVFAVSGIVTTMDCEEGVALFDLHQVVVRTNIADTTVTSSVELDSANENLMVFPNPASEYIYIRYSKDEKAKCILYSIDGERINRFSFKGDYKLNIQNLDSGIYVLQVETKSGLMIKRLVIQR